MARQKSRLRDEKIKVKDANQELRAQVRQLRKQLNQALRELEQLRDTIDEENNPIQRPEPTRGPTCRECKSDNIVIIPTGVKDVIACLGCGKKYTKEKDDGSEISKPHG